ncbi:MAG: hypothetical protein ACREVW_01080 [Burkholderiales bacterium]
MKPATPLPWTISVDTCAKCRENGTVEVNIDQVPCGYHAQFSGREDAAYIVAACNAYPQLVAALRRLMEQAPRVSSSNPEASGKVAAWESARALLHSLGEDA